ncbi:MAG: ABC transporter permease [Ardenticatenales bacterium]|nr:ABC transporter permease [Ardenticatenales bacterium]MCB8952537.1 ABC transporter permease [Ardenticatenales bacterium]
MSVAELDVDALQAEALLTSKPEPLLLTYWNRLRRHRLATASLVVILLMLLTVVVGPMVMGSRTYYNYAQKQDMPYTRDTQDLLNRNAAPSVEHPLGTDELGRDVLMRLLLAGQLSLFIAFTVTIFQETIGIFIGAVSGYFGGLVDNLIQRLVEFIIILPGLPLLLTLSALLRNVSIPFLKPEWGQAVVIVLILVTLGWTGSCRLARAMVLSLRNQEFTEASKALGLSDLRIIVRHMLPNALPPIIVSATLGFGGVIIYESALSFLGFGIQQPVATWGNMLQDVQKDMFTAPWKAFYPGFAIFITSLAFNYFGDGLRDALDPRLKL